MTERPGVYAITNWRNGKLYVGSAANISKRWSRHRKDLRAGTHPNRHLQAAWHRDGEAAFEFVVLEFTQDLTGREQYWLDLLGATDPACGYNVAPVARSSRGLKRGPIQPHIRAAMQAGLAAAGYGKGGFGLTVAPMHGTANHAAKLTDDDVRAIRDRYGPITGPRKPQGGVTYASLATEYGVTQGVICEVVHRKTWRHVE